MPDPAHGGGGGGGGGGRGGRGGGAQMAPHRAKAVAEISLPLLKPLFRRALGLLKAAKHDTANFEVFIERFNTGVSEAARGRPLTLALIRGVALAAAEEVELHSTVKAFLVVFIDSWAHSLRDLEVPDIEEKTIRDALPGREGLIVAALESAIKPKEAPKADHQSALKGLDKAERRALTEALLWLDRFFPRLGREFRRAVGRATDAAHLKEMLALDPSADEAQTIPVPDSAVLPAPLGYESRYQIWFFRCQHLKGLVGWTLADELWAAIHGEETALTQRVRGDVQAATASLEDYTDNAREARLAKETLFTIPVDDGEDIRVPKWAPVFLVALAGAGGFLYWLMGQLH